MSLRVRILLLVLLATLMPALVLGFHFFNERDRAIDDAKDNLGALAKYVAENLDDKVKGTVQLLHGLSRAPDIDTTDAAACSAFLAGVLRRYPQYTGLITIKPNGDLHCDSLRLGRKLNVSGREYFKQVRSSLQPAFDVVIGGLTGIAVLQVAYPVLDGQGSLKYVLLASLNLSEFAEGVAAASHYPNISLLIWNRKGILMVRKPDAGRTDLVGKDFAASELFLFTASQDSGAWATLPGADGVRRVWALGVLPEPRGGGARMVLGISQEMLVAEANRNLRDALILLLGISLLAFIVAWYVAEYAIRRHVRSIANVAGHIGAKDLGARNGPPYPRGELGELMAVVDRTAEAVQAQQVEIAAASRDLKKANRMFRALSSINALIVRVHDRDELFSQACRIAVEVGGFRMALLSLVDPGVTKVVPVASAGVDEELLSAIKVRLSSSEDAPSTMIAQALREKKPVVSNDSLHDSRVLFGKKYAEAGVRAMAILPLIVADEGVGVLALYSAEAGYFDEEEIKLLTELAGDIAFAVDHLDKQEQLDYLAYYDALTGLANRALFHERLQQSVVNAKERNRKLALVLIDIERFKSINDSLGRPIGDALLKEVAARMTAFAVDAGRLARIAADHFAVMVPEVQSGEELARLIEQQVSEVFGPPFWIGESELRVSGKFGIAMYPGDGADADTLFRNAEAALKKAKAGGERYLFYTQTMNARVAESLTLENNLRQALDKGEFVLHYQPKVNLLNGKMTSAEALIRWNDPRTGLVPPGRFIPVLEETGLIHEVGRWAVRQAIEDYLRWRAAGLAAVRISVNVSPRQLRSRGFIAEIEQAIGIDPQAAAGLELEITESVVMEDVGRSITSLKAIRAMGVTIAIDDFGTGFSSLSYLAQLPVDTLKIDRSFVINMTTGPQGMALVSTIINLAHSLKLKVVAEGVETKEQARLLRLLTCDEMQGFLFSKAVPSEILETSFLALPAAA